MYFRGNPDRYRGLGLLSSTQQPPGPRLKRDKAAGKGRRLFEKAYTASLTYKPELESTDRILNVHVSERLFTERLQFSLSLPETSNSGGNMGLLEDFHISSLPDLTGAKRARPVYKDDKREQRREQKALIAAGKLAPEIAGAALQDIPSGASTPVTLPFDPVNVSESGMLMTGFDTQVDLFATAGSQPPLSADSSGFSTGVMAEEIGTNHPFVEEMDFKMEEIEEVEPAPAAPMLDWDDLLDMPMDKTPASSDPTILSQQKALGVSEAPTSVNGTTGHAPLSNTTLTTSAAPSPSTFKLKMKAVLPPAPSTSVPLTSVIDLDPPNEIVETPSPRPLEQTLSASPTSSIHLEATLSQQDQIRCICSEASTDFGSFMISCDECTVWFHGECVGLGPTSIPEGGSWFCFRCKLS